METDYDSEGVCDVNTNSTGKVRRATSKPRTGRGEAEDVKKQEREGSEKCEPIKTSSSSELRSNSKKKEKSVKDGAQDCHSEGLRVHNDMRRVKNIKMGEIPLCPVGLSLSGSGMQLFVKMDKLMHKKHLDQLQSQFVAKVCRAKRPARNLNRRKKKTVCRQPSTGPPSTDEPDLDDSGVCVQSKDTEPTSDSQFKNVTFPIASSSFCKADIVDLTGPASVQSEIEDYVSHCDIFIKKEFESEKNKLCEAMAEKTLRHISSSPRSSPVELLSATSSVYGKRPSLCKQSSKFKPQSSLIRVVNKKKDILCKEKRDAKRDRVIQTSPVVDLAVFKPKAVAPNVIKNKKRPMAAVFTSSDLPLKRQSVVGSCSSGDILIYQQRNNSSFSPIQATRASKNNAFCSPNVSNAGLCLPLEPTSDASFSPRNAVSGRYDSSMNRANVSESSRYALIDSSNVESLPLTEPVTAQDNPSLFDHDGESSNVQVPDDQRLEGVTPPPYADFDMPQALALGGVDAETLNKFIEYTRSMRRDLKQNYKKLSVLMKSFNQQVLEHSRQQVDMTISGSKDLDVTDDMFEPDRGNRCVLM